LPQVSDLLPRMDEKGRLNSYTSIRNYIECLGGFFASEYRDTEAVLSEVAAGRSFRRIQAGKCTDVGEVARLLRHSWLAEIQLAARRDEPTTFRYTDCWAPTYVYYAVCLSARAMFGSRGFWLGEAHRPALNALANDIKARRDLFPQPFRTYCTWDKLTSACITLHHPESCRIERINSLSNASLDTFWSRFAMLLKTTHAEKLKRVEDEWKRRNGRQRMPNQQKAEVVKGVPPTTLFDFLYRLRIRANYQEVDSFLVAIRFRHTPSDFQKHLATICWHCLLVLEMLTVRQLGISKYNNILDGFVRYDVDGLASKLAAARYSLISSVLK